jgi:hypothetical protein
LRNVEYKFREEGYLDCVKQRGIDPGHDVFQVFGNPSELKTSESSNPMVRDLRLANTARLVTIAPGEKYPEGGISQR